MSIKNKETRDFLEKICGGPLKFGSLLNSLRLCDEVTQTDLARKAGVSRSLICDIEKGRRYATIGQAAKFAKIMGYPPESFISVLFQEQLRRANLRYKVTVSQAA